MLYQWNNKKRLLTLKISSKGNILVFKTKTEKAEIHIIDQDIAKVICWYNNKKTVINKKERYHLVVGEGNTKRDVYHYIKPDGPLPFLRTGITKHRGKSTWSSLPHRFELEKEKGFEEVFFYLLKGGSRRAIQVGRGVWCDGKEVDEVWSVGDRSFSTIPLGYHPVVAEPGVNVSYIWVYLAKKKKWEKI